MNEKCRETHSMRKIGDLVLWWRVSLAPSRPLQTTTRDYGRPPRTDRAAPRIAAPPVPRHCLTCTRLVIPSASCHRPECGALRRRSLKGMLMCVVSSLIHPILSHASNALLSRVSPKSCGPVPRRVYYRKRLPSTALLPSSLVWPCDMRVCPSQRSRDASLGSSRPQRVCGP